MRSSGTFTSPQTAADLIVQTVLPDARVACRCCCRGVASCDRFTRSAISGLHRDPLKTFGGARKWHPGDTTPIMNPQAIIRPHLDGIDLDRQRN